MKKIFVFLVFCAFSGFAQDNDSLQIRRIYDEILTNGECYKTLTHLCKNIGPRLSGSTGAAKAVQYTKKVMENYGFQKVFLQDVMVPHWVRGAKEDAYIENGKVKTKVPIVALGGSVATPATGIKAEVIEVQTFEELKR